MKRLLIVFLIAVVLFPIVACKKEVIAQDIEIRLKITKDFGKEMLLDKSVQVQKGISVLELTRQNVNLETSYGGKFIESINGIKSGDSAWFYYINDTMAQVGADDYKIKQGDVIVWDYHRWAE